jgi:Holliday junction resolvase YEN1
VLSEDVDTLMFGSALTIRNWSPEQKSSKTPTHVNVYDAVETKNGPSGLDREGMILVALMSGGDYVPEGIPGCGIKKACEAARAGFGTQLCSLAGNDAKGLQDWRERLQHEIKTNESRFFAQKRPSLKIPPDFPRTDILGYYTHPAVSKPAGLDRLKSAIKWDQDLDFPGLRSFTHDAFDWTKLQGAKHFVRSLAPSLLIRQLRMRAEQIERFPCNDIQAIQEDEALLVKGIHGKRQHAVTDSSTELRVSFTPIELVKIDLSTEEPDDEVDVPLTSEADLDDEIPLEVDDDTEGPRKRGPTKFDPHKPARVWVLETYVKVGVPLKVQDWEAERQRPLRSKRTASANDTSTRAARSIGGRLTRVADSAQQISIQNFAKVTKPGSKATRASSKSQATVASQHSTSTKNAVVSLLSSSPVRMREANPLRSTREESLSPLLELPSSVTKRRRRPMQRAHTLPSNYAVGLDRAKSPTPGAIETLDLVDAHTTTLISQDPAKKPKTQAMKEIETSRSTCVMEVTASPNKTRQTTLDIWRSPGNSPNKSRKSTPPLDILPKPRPPRFVVTHGGMDTLDLTLSSPLALSPQAAIVSQESKRTSNRPPLTSVSSNASFVTEVASSITADTSPKAKAEAVAKSRRTSPRLRRTQSVSPEIESLDLTEPSLPPPDEQKSAFRPSPRTHTTMLPKAPVKTTPPSAVWKTQAKKKREVVLRKSLAGAWAFVDVQDDGEVRKGKERKRWRESEIDFLDLC